MPEEPLPAQDEDDAQDTAKPEDFEDDPARNPDDDQLKDIKGG